MNKQEQVKEILSKYGIVLATSYYDEKEEMVKELSSLLTPTVDVEKIKDKFEREWVRGEFHITDDEDYEDCIDEEKVFNFFLPYIQPQAQSNMEQAFNKTVEAWNKDNPKKKLLEEAQSVSENKTSDIENSKRTSGDTQGVSGIEEKFNYNFEKSKKLGFGDYVDIEMKRYGVSNEMYQHKVINHLRSNVWVDVPVQSPATERLHKEMEDVVSCVVCGISETEVLKYRLKDVKPYIQPRNAVIKEDLLQGLMDIFTYGSTYSQEWLDNKRKEITNYLLIKALKTNESKEVKE